MTATPKPDSEARRARIAGLLADASPARTLELTPPVCQALRIGSQREKGS